MQTLGAWLLCAILAVNQPLILQKHGRGKMKITKSRLKRLIKESIDKNSNDFESNYFDSLDLIETCIAGKYGEDVADAVYRGLNAYFSDSRANKSDLETISRIASTKSSFPNASHLRFEDEKISPPQQNKPFQQNINRTSNPEDNETDDEFNARLDAMIKMAGKGADFFKNLKI